VTPSQVTYLISPALSTSNETLSTQDTGVSVGVGVGVGTIGVGVGVLVGVLVGVAVGPTGVAVGVGVGVAVGPTGVAVGVGVGVLVGVAVGPETKLIDIHCVVPEHCPLSTLTYKLTTVSVIPDNVFGKLDTDCPVTKLVQPLPQDAPVQPDIETVLPVISSPTVPKFTKALNAIFYKY